MPTPEGLLVHLAAALRLPAEPLATEALAWVLRDQAAARGLASRLRTVDAALPDFLEVRHQVVAADGSRPDLVGYDAGGAGRLVIEVKFDAPLMPSQPRGYLVEARNARDQARGSGDAGASAIVVFIIPQQRVESLWPLILDRAREDWPELQASARTAQLEVGLHLLCLSWTEALAALESGLAEVGRRTRHEVAVDEPAGSAAAAGLEQLRDLVAVYESRGFAPLRVDDLTDRRFPLLWTSLTDVVRDAVDRLVAEPDSVVDRSGLTQGWGPDLWGPYLRLAGLECRVEKNARYWRDYGQSPLWLWVYGSDPKRAARFRRALAGWEAQVPPRLIQTHDNALIVPLLVPLDAEREECVWQVVQQLQEVGRRLAAD